MNPGIRLSTAASFLDANRKLVDIGTDHAYLPAYLVLHKQAKHVLACDIGKQPLENARKTVEKYGLSERVTLRLSDGLSAVLPEETEEVSVCGMGGTLMREILSACTWLPQDGMHLVLQPQSHDWEVREYLFTHGFRIEAETALFDSNKLYITISAFYDGISRTGSPGLYRFGSFLTETDEASRCYVEKQRKQLRTRLDALSDREENREEIGYLQSCLAYYKQNVEGEMYDSPGNL